MAKYEVIVGNIGKVYAGGGKTKARQTFEDYKQISINGPGRAEGEDVTLMIDGEPAEEWTCSLLRHRPARIH